jgi:hypothetical protein
MTPEERFERIESILLQNTSQIATLLKAQLKNEHLMSEIQATQQKTQEQLDEFARDTRASIEDMVQFGMDTFELVAENSTYIRGLQIENRRILRELRDCRRDDQRQGWGARSR